MFHATPGMPGVFLLQQERPLAYICVNVYPQKINGTAFPPG